MDLTRIKQFVKHDRDHKFIFVENGEPEMVVMSFAEYERLMRHEDDEVGYPSLFRAGAPELERHIEPPSAPERAPLPRFAGFGQGGAVGLPIHLEDIRLEDLPV